MKQVSEVANDELLAAVTSGEVKHAVFAMHPDKASSPDGLNPSFFQAFWPIMEGDVVNFLRKYKHMILLINR